MRASSGRAFGIGRRHFLTSMAGLAGLTGFLPGSLALADSSSGSPTNPKFIYSFNPRGMELGTACDSLSFSRSGRYLAVVNQSSPYSSHASLSVWDINARESVFKITDPQVIAPLSINATPMWGMDDAWVSSGIASPDGSLVCLSPQSGKVVNRIQEAWGECKINEDGTKIISRLISNGLKYPSLTVFDFMGGGKTLIPLDNCSTGKQLSVLSDAWLGNEEVFLLGYSAISGSATCSADDVALSQRDQEAPTHHYFTSIINSKSQEKLAVRNFDGGPPIGIRTVSNYRNKSVYIGGNIIINGHTLDVIPLWIAQEFIPSGSAAFSPDGTLLYVPTFTQDVRAPSGSRQKYGAIFNASTGIQVGQFPAAKYQANVAISPDGRYLALARDSDVELYSLL